MGQVIRLLVADYCEDDHRLYHVIDRACAICVPDPHTRDNLWSKEFKRWFPLAWVDDDVYWDPIMYQLRNGDEEVITIPAWPRRMGPGTKIVIEKLPDEFYDRLMDSMRTPGRFNKIWFEYEDGEKKKELMDGRTICVIVD